MLLSLPQEVQDKIFGYVLTEPEKFRRQYIRTRIPGHNEIYSLILEGGFTPSPPICKGLQKAIYENSEFWMYIDEDVSEDGGLDYLFLHSLTADEKRKVKYCRFIVNEDVNQKVAKEIFFRELESILTTAVISESLIILGISESETTVNRLCHLIRSFQRDGGFLKRIYIKSPP
ncbi:hypothetical protein K469DRAFT_716135 [Zopfia rhizophila CBS 207.26]|uniref:Uncharacterized protein n=1 Tax=Zopfia rhizophila CBS 207.26 TaxID=1314779 RepID=A0A6A6DL00_9PEZI|nr:hypothetical protein K469DRAFT_716135 [Zopfia rhizophila CBS 207.26]